MEIKGDPPKLRMTSHVRQLKGERNTRDLVHAGDVGNLLRGDSQPNFVIITYIISLSNLSIMLLFQGFIKFIMPNYYLWLHHILIFLITSPLPMGWGQLPFSIVSLHINY